MARWRDISIAGWRFSGMAGGELAGGSIVGGSIVGGRVGRGGGIALRVNALAMPGAHSKGEL